MVITDEQEETHYQDDCVWMIASSFTIFTMTAGFGLLESGRVASKDEVNVMIKNIFDMIFGGLAYWMLGFGFTFGDYFLNPYLGFGNFFFDPERTHGEQSLARVKGKSYALFLFQMSFATTTSTIVSAGLSERIHLKSHCFIAFLITLVHSVAAHWVWAESGMFRTWGVVDSAGCSPVHLVGGISGLVATLYVGPRRNRFTQKGRKEISDPTKAILGFTMIWWGWLAFNTASNYAVSERQWTEGIRSAVGTILASAGGGIVSLCITQFTTRKIQVDMMIDGVLASLVSSTAGCLFFTPWQATVVGAIGSALALITYPILEFAKIDDPVGVIPVHMIGAIWGMLSPGLFLNERHALHVHSVTNMKELSGVFYGGGLSLLGRQVSAILIISAFTAVCVFILLYSLQHSPMGLRLSQYEEEMGADLREHGLAGLNIMRYIEEKTMNAQQATALMMLMLRWRAKARKGAELRRRLRSLTGQEETETEQHELQPVSSVSSDKTLTDNISDTCL